MPPSLVCGPTERDNHGKKNKNAEQSELPYQTPYHLLHIKTHKYLVEHALSSTQRKLNGHSERPQSAHHLPTPQSSMHATQFSSMLLGSVALLVQLPPCHPLWSRTRWAAACSNVVEAPASKGWRCAARPCTVSGTPTHKPTTCTWLRIARATTHACNLGHLGPTCRHAWPSRAVPRGTWPTDRPYKS
jgi:hypothetical protein